MTILRPRGKLVVRPYDMLLATEEYFNDTKVIIDLDNMMADESIALKRSYDALFVNPIEVSSFGLHSKVDIFDEVWWFKIKNGIAANKEIVFIEYSNFFKDPDLFLLRWKQAIKHSDHIVLTFLKKDAIRLQEILLQPVENISPWFYLLTVGVPYFTNELDYIHLNSENRPFFIVKYSVDMLKKAFIDWETGKKPERLITI